MVCHLQYFEVKKIEMVNVSAIFNSMGYVKNMGIDLTKGTLFDIQITEDEKKRLEDAVKQSDIDSQKGQLPGIINLIQTVEQLQMKYGKVGEHTHGTKEIVEAMCDNPALVQYYGLEKLAEKLYQVKKPTNMLFVNQKQQKKYGTGQN